MSQDNRILIAYTVSENTYLVSEMLAANVQITPTKSFQVDPPATYQFSYFLRDQWNIIQFDFSAVSGTLSLVQNAQVAQVWIYLNRETIQ